MRASLRSTPLLLAAAVCASAGSAPGPGPVIAAARQAEPVTDADGHVYRTVRIGSQTWMAENLRSTRYADGAPLEWFTYRHDSTLARVYGRLYRWRAAMRGASSSGASPSGVQGACPSGWHVPSIAEWQQLLAHLGGETAAGPKLKATRLWRAGAAATDESGFSALPSGWYDFTGAFEGLGGTAFLRSATAEDTGPVRAVGLRAGVEAASLVRLHPDDAIPLRCVRDP